MNSIKFCKFHGFGNDYIVIENDELKSVADLSEFSKKICHRNVGVGGDGIAVLEKLETGADYVCRIINPDGSEAGFSGNGTRCAVAYLFYKNLFAGENLDLQTKSGIKKYQLLKRTENSFWFLAKLGKPKFDLPDSPFFREINAEMPEISKFSSILLPQLGIVTNFFYVDVGNPVVCIFVENFDAFAEDSKVGWRQVGQAIESVEEIFPDRTNVVFVKVIDEKNIEIRIWERGAGETSSSGTCSIAAAVASVSTNKTGREIFVHAEGGTTDAVWRKDGEMMITGRADLSFCGKFYF